MQSFKETIAPLPAGHFAFGLLLINESPTTPRFSSLFLFSALWAFYRLHTKTMAHHSHIDEVVGK
jgi:hypothetical protein